MPDDATDPSSRGPIDTEILDRIAAHLARSDRFDDIQTQPEYALNAVVGDGLDSARIESKNDGDADGDGILRIAAVTGADARAPSSCISIHRRP